MDCDKAIERLPWLLNGTLDGDERREVLAHVRDCARCREALAETRAALRLFDWHPAPAELIALAAAPAAAAADPALADHLAACARCTAELELVRASRLLAEAPPDAAERLAFLTPAAATPPRAAAPPAAGVDRGAAAPRAWRLGTLAASLAGLIALGGWGFSLRHAQTLEQQLARLAPPSSGGVAAISAGAAAPRAAGTPAATAPAARGGNGATPTPPATAAGGDSLAALRQRAAEAQTRLAELAAANRLLAAREVEQEATLAALEQRTAPVGGGGGGRPIESVVAMVEATPAEQASRGNGAPPTALLPLSRGNAVLLLHTRERGRHTAFELEIHDAQDQPVGGAIAVALPIERQDDFDELNVTLHRNALPPGTYTFRLFGRGEGESAGRPGREAVATYTVRVS
jgi:hypothetical protein